ncbi:MAG TPA: transglutaminase domain-containing protein, partial [Candidatus Acidoferrum sp.]|nr:transglutaminase domain-containing protein [Candidatus Acidoferrum sp.]
MHIRPLTARLAALLIITLSVSVSAFASSDDAWKALHNLDIPKAKELFTQELTRTPKDVSLMRGLLLTAYFDYDHETQVKMINDIIAADPSNIYLLAIFEHVAAEMLDWSDHIDLQYAIGDALAKHAPPNVAFLGRQMLHSCYTYTATKQPKSWALEMGDAPGFWVTGPFDNHAEIANYRPVPFEGESLDTLATTTGKNGSRVGWTWLDKDSYSDFSPTTAMLSASDIACQARTYFELPEDREILVLLGGAFSGRVLVDGRKVHDDPVYRNAVQREGFQVRLPKGPHEITLVIGAADQGILFHIALVGVDRKPIPGLKWLRYAAVKKSDAVTAKAMHPIFDVFDSTVAAAGLQPDTRFWKAVLQIDNGYAREAVRELESLYNEGKLSLLETWMLYRSLLMNDEGTRGNEYLGKIKAAVSTPRTDLLWITASGDNFDARLTAWEELNRKYPGRAETEQLAALKPIATRDTKTLIANVQALTVKYPEVCGFHDVLERFYADLVKDPESAFKEFTLARTLAKSKRSLLLQTPRQLIRMSKYDDAIKAARLSMREFPGGTLPIEDLVDACTAAHREQELIPLLDSLIARYPYNVDYYNMLYGICSSGGKFDRAKQILQQIHSLRPKAILPYTDLDSLHNNVSYDSIFGSIDVMSLWDTTPTESDLGGNKMWSLLDRRQKLVFETGVMLEDIHYARVAVDRSAIEDMQETDLGFEPDRTSAPLLVARRLRQGQPPLQGVLDGSKVVFKDLQPGDAIELHYRIWSSNEGDLWKEFWDTYYTHSTIYERFWEYDILSNRQDLRYQVVAPAGEPTIAQHCGFKRLTWHGEKVPAWRLDVEMLPPSSDLLGRVAVTTISSWQVINHWYQSIADAIVGENPRSDQLADSLTAGLTTVKAKLGALYKYIVLELPYQTIQFDYQAAIPHKPDDVLLNKWGDCKDKGMLLVQMLRHLGIAAWPVLVMTRDNGTSLPLPQFEFDHLIVATVVGGDTLFTDPTEVPFPPEHSLTTMTFGQPCEVIGVGQTDNIGKLPPMSIDDSHRSIRMTLSPVDTGAMALKLERTYFNQEAGFDRYQLRGVDMAEYKKNLETDYTTQWGVSVTVDSAQHDSIRTIDTLFKEVIYGSIALSVQTIGKTTILTPPAWSIIPKSLLPRLVSDGKREFPIDLR